MAGQVAPAAVCVPLVGGAPLVDARFVARPNRFVVAAELADSRQVMAHLADRGRLIWLQPGTRLLLGAKPAAGRKTPYQVAAAERGGLWSSLDTHLPNRLIEQALRTGALPAFAGYTTVRREVTCGASRFDFCLTRPGPAGEERCFVEVKSAGDVQDGVARFPDAPTTRGVRHLAELTALHQAGVRTAVIFVVQCGGAVAVESNMLIDPDFAAALASTIAAGVEVYAFGCMIERSGITLGCALPVRTPAPPSDQC